MGFPWTWGFDMLVRNTEGKVASGFLRPQFVGDVLLGSVWEFIKEWNGMEWNDH